MKSSATVFALLALCVGLAFANVYRPRTLDEKVQDADLIVRGTATAFGAERDAGGGLHERSLRVEVSQVLWPSSYTNTNAIVFRYYIVKAWSRSWWDYTNTAGVFFLIKSKRPETGQWDRLEGFDDWMEPQTNATAIQALITELKKSQTQTNREAWKKIAGWREPMPKVNVLSGNELEIGGVRCRLFGVHVPTNAETAGRAKRFLELYMKTFGDYYTIYNSDHPVTAEDGVPLIWLLGHSNGGWAQEALVEAGLADVDYSGFESYRFYTPGKSGTVECDWKQCLKNAIARNKNGERPQVCSVSPNFSWPVAKQEYRTNADASATTKTVEHQTERITVGFASTYQLAPPDTIMVIVRLNKGDVYAPDLKHSIYVDQTGHRIQGLNVIEQHHDEYPFDGYSECHYLVLVPRPLTKTGHFMLPGTHSVEFRYSLNGHQYSAFHKTTVESEKPSSPK
jgi:hypothetical protein